MMKIARNSQGITIFIVGHVTKKKGWWPDTECLNIWWIQFYISRDRHAAYRLLRAVKNRFGSTNEIRVFEK